MSRKFLTHVDLVTNELQNAVMQNLSSAPGAPKVGQMYYNTSTNTLSWWNGSAWIAAQGGAGAVPSDVNPVASGPGATSIPGVSTLYSRGDHSHSNVGYGSPTAETTFGAGGSNGVQNLVARSDHSHGNPTHAAADHTTIPLSTFSAPTADVSWGAKKITSLADPVALGDAANKNYVDSVAQGLDAKQSCLVGTTPAGGNIANLATGAPNTLDGFSLAGQVGARVLVKDQTTAGQNGIYVIGTVGTGSNGTWARATDADLPAEMNNAYVWIEAGTVNADTGWVQTGDIVTLGTTPQTWVQFASAGIVTAGNGLLKTGNSIDIIPDASLTAAADLLSVNFAGTGSASTAARSDHTHVANTRIISQGTAAATSTIINHSFGTRDVQVNVYRNSAPYDTVDCDVERTDTANVTCKFSVATASNEHRIVITG